MANKKLKNLLFEFSKKKTRSFDTKTEKNPQTTINRYIEKVYPNHSVIWKLKETR